MKWRLAVAFLALLLPIHAAPLVVHFEERHSGSFFHFAETLDLEASATLLLIDAHSDASCVADSDKIRAALRQVKSSGHRRELLQNWRRSGRVQVFDWIEPLMPHPVKNVVWIANEEELAAARQQVDRLAPARSCGPLGASWTSSLFSGIETQLAEEEAVIVSLDLDYFAGWPRAEAREGLQDLWARLLRMQNLQSISVALSRPWLEDEEEARFLAEEVLALILSSRNTRLHFEPFAPLGPDRSEEARRRLALGEQQPTFDFTTVSDHTKDLVLQERSRITVRSQPERWANLLENWQRIRGGWWLEVDNHQPSLDKRIRIAKDNSHELPTLRVRNREGRLVNRVTWYREGADGTNYNVMPEVSLGKQFADAAQWLGWHSQLLAETSEPALAGAQWSPALAQPQGWGALRIWAEVESDSETYRTPPLELRVRAGEGFRGALTEQFGLPYLFGVGRLRSDGWSGPELGWGNDCANLLAWAWQQDGFPLPWCSPGQLRQHLQLMGNLTDEIKFSPTELDRGLVLDRGNHMAALWKDLEPKGRLDGSDLLIHQLGGPAEVISVATFVKSSQSTRVWKRPEMPSPVLTFGGDINLDGIEREETLRTIQRAAGERSLVANLECALSSSPEQPDGHYRFSADPEWAVLLRKSGIAGLGLANNHALDCGPTGLEETRKSLTDAGIQITGAGNTLEEALRPIRLQEPNREIVVFAVNLINIQEMALREGKPGVLCLPDHQDPLRNAIRKERAQGREVIVMAHWGQEFTTQVSATQLHWARWLIESGATQVIGSHPHIRQHTDYWRGRRVDFSLGDLVFPLL